jgi:hypothetical protein
MNTVLHHECQRFNKLIAVIKTSLLEIQVGTGISVCLVWPVQ